MQCQARLVHVDEVAPVPWRNGGGLTRELLAWPEPQAWTVRISVADITASGPFSQFPGVDRWFAVLSGGALQLATAGAAPRELDQSAAALHAFSGEPRTDCTLLGAATRDFNLMLRREAGWLRQRPLQGQAALDTRAAAAALFVAGAAEVRDASTADWRLPPMTLVWWSNPQRERLRAAATGLRGWRIEMDTGAER